MEMLNGRGEIAPPLFYFCQYFNPQQFFTAAKQSIAGC